MIIQGAGVGGSTRGYSISTGTIAHEVFVHTATREPLHPLPSVIHNTEQQRLAGMAMSYGLQNTGYKPFESPSVADYLSPEFFGSLNQRTRLSVINTPLVEQNSKFGQNFLQAKEGPNGPYVTISDINNAQYDPSVIAHETLHTLGFQNSGTVDQILSMLPANVVEAARRSYLSRGLSLFERTVLAGTWYTAPIKRYVVPGSQEQFAEVLSQNDVADLVGQNPALKEPLRQFFTEQALTPYSATLNRTPEGTISLDQSGVGHQYSLVPYLIRNDLTPHSLSSPQQAIQQRVLEMINPFFARRINDLFNVLGF